jgi:hypothetical protein
MREEQQLPARALEPQTGTHPAMSACAKSEVGL